MAPLSKNGIEIARIEFERTQTDLAEADPMICVDKIEYSLRSNGITLKQRRSFLDYGFGGGAKWYGGGWKRAGKIKAHLLDNAQALKDALQLWAEKMWAKGWAASIKVGDTTIDFEK